MDFTLGTVAVDQGLQCTVALLTLRMGPGVDVHPSMVATRRLEGQYSTEQGYADRDILKLPHIYE